MSAQRNKGKTQPQLNQQLAAQDEQRRRQEQVAQKKESDRYLAKKMSDFVFDIAKLIIGGVILAGLMKQDIDYWKLAIAGFLVVIIFIAFGVYLIRKFKLK